MTKKLILLLIILTTFMNVSYASFPVTVTLKVQEDILQSETTQQYDLRMRKMGFDLSICNCASCRTGIPIAIEGIGDATKWYLK
jgi:hypothetical protein